MPRRRLTIQQLRRVLKSFGVNEDASRGKGSHTLFYRDTASYSMPTRRDVLPCYVDGCRKKFNLRPEDGVSDDDFYGRA